MVEEEVCCAVLWAEGDGRRKHDFEDANGQRFLIILV